MTDSGGRRVLYVDSDAAARRRVASALAAEGLDVRTAATAAEALGGLRSRGVDCVVTAYDLSDDHGGALVRGVRTIAPGLAVTLFADAGVDPPDAAATGDLPALVPRSEGPAGLAERVAGELRSGGGWAPGDPGRAVPEALKERAMDEAPVGITISDPSLPDNPLIYVNQAYVEMTGYREDEVLGRNCRLLQGEGTNEDRVAEMAAAIARDEPVTVELRNYRKDGTEFWNRVDIAPIVEDGAVTNYVGFQTDITERKRAERRAERNAVAARREQANLEHLVDRVQGLMRDVTATTVRAESRDEMEREVCARIAATDNYVAAWVGDLVPTLDRVEARASAGESADRLADLSVDVEAASGPTAEAATTDAVRAVVRASDPLHAGASAVAPPSAEALAAVPLAYRDSRYGVLNVYAADAEAFDDRETVVLESLARAVASAVARFESRRVLTSHTVTELTVGFSDETNPFVALATDADARLEYEGGLLDDEGRWVTFFAVDGADPERVCAAASTDPAVAAATPLSTADDGGVVEITVADPTLVELLADSGARTTGVTVTPDGHARLRLDVADRDAVRTVVESVAAVYDGTELLATHERDRPSRTPREFRSNVIDQLTERQRVALQKAYLGGFFEWPHEVSGDELAESMGISRSTFHQHLRAAERKIVAELFADAVPD
ncbi:bacterio-opsin activator domain-containing protein [Halostella salina]|uniref:bacterio-opsin activator domain-containing protein n=1 Tax=Halostella salina TaxID=1547897 RepID=UPI000EF852EB|nr:bacterio-opsin activator domain-containing protein [Halostella salina]